MASPTTTKVTKSTVEQEQALAADREAQLVAEKKRLDAELKELRANKQSVSKLDKEINRPAPKWFAEVLQGMLRRRVEAGQPYDEALSQILDNCRTMATATPTETTDSAE